MVLRSTELRRANPAARRTEKFRPRVLDSQRGFSTQQILFECLCGDKESCSHRSGMVPDSMTGLADLLHEFRMLPGVLLYKEKGGADVVSREYFEHLWCVDRIRTVVKGERDTGSVVFTRHKIPGKVRASKSISAVG